jgi:hypothetical protein
MAGTVGLMDHLQRERDVEPVNSHGEEPPAPASVPAGSLAWASAVGNQAVQRLAREAMPEAEEAEAEEAPPEVAAMEAAGIGPAEAAGLEAVDDLAEDELPA